MFVIKPPYVNNMAPICSDKGTFDILQLVWATAIDGLILFQNSVLSGELHV